MDTEKNSLFDSGYSLNVSYQDIPWEETLQEAIDGWFNLGMLTSEIVYTWEEEDEMGFLFTSGEPNNRTLQLFIYSPIVDEPDRRLWITLGIDQEIFNRDDARLKLEHVAINGNELSISINNEELLELLESNLD